MAVTPWADAEFAASVWPDAGKLDPAVVTALLEASTEACQEFAPALESGATPPARYRLACVLHARDVWSASSRDGDVLGVGDYAVRVRPLSGTVLQLLRPRQGRPRVGGVRTTA